MIRRPLASRFRETYARLAGQSPRHSGPNRRPVGPLDDRLHVERFRVGKRDAQFKSRAEVTRRIRAEKGTWATIAQTLQVLDSRRQRDFLDLPDDDFCRP